jgi:hypothetical protein
MDQKCAPCGCVGHSVTSAHTDIAIDNNGTWQDAFQFVPPDGVSWILSNNFEMDVQANRYDVTPLISLSTVNGRIIVDDVNQRVIHLNVTASDIQANLRPGEYVYDLVMMDNSLPPIRTVLMHGRIVVGQGVSYP